MILIIGANGLIGRQIRRLFKENRLAWTGTYHKRNEDSLLQLDITDPSGVQEIFTKISPVAVFHCANLAGGVDFCESNPALAMDFHLKATERIGSLCRDIDAKMIFMSTDYVFDGNKDAYKEKDIPNPLNLYGKLKLEAENWIKKNLSRYLIIRTTNVFGWDPLTETPNYIMSLYHNVKSGKRFDAPSYLWGNPTYVGDLAKAIIELYLQDTNGIFHIVGDSFISRYHWATQACNILGLDASLVEEVKELPQRYIPRPLKSRLSTEKFKKSYKTVLHEVLQGLELMRKEMEKSTEFKL